MQAVVPVWSRQHCRAQPACTEEYFNAAHMKAWAAWRVGRPDVELHSNLAVHHVHPCMYWMGTNQT